jgi:tripartite-type tricarboxylate transporter receptor subunit TctC
VDFDPPGFVSQAPLRLFALALTLALSCVAAAQSSTYPNKPIRLVVPFPPGAGTDTVARYVAQKLGESIKGTIVVDNRTGAGGAVAPSKSRGRPRRLYALLFVAGPFTAVAAASKNAGYDPLKQFVPVKLDRDQSAGVRRQSDGSNEHDARIHRAHEA